MATISECKEVWYVPGALHVVDMIDPETGLTWCNGRDEAEVLSIHPEAKRTSLEDASKQISVAEAFRYVKGVSEIRRSDYWYALEVLPPMGWKTARGVESFKMSEWTCGTITQIFAQCGPRYFTLANRFTLSADEIAGMVADYIAAHPEPEPAKHFEWLD